MRLRGAGVLALVALLMLQGSCSIFRRNSANAKCREPAVPAAAEYPALKVPAGLDAPDTRNAVKVPVLNEPEKARSKADPCLSQPPSYGS
jgi:uncharacterized lipoprotein